MLLGNTRKDEEHAIKTSLCRYYEAKQGDDSTLGQQKRAEKWHDCTRQFRHTSATFGNVALVIAGS